METPENVLSSDDSQDYSSSVDSDIDSDNNNCFCNGHIDDESSVLFSFYDELIEHLISHFNKSRDNIRILTNFLLNSYKNTVNGRNPNKLDFNNLELCLGYLHRYAICHTDMVRSAMSNVLDSSAIDVTRKLNLKRLDIVFLGCGPGNDFVGFLSALYGHHDRLFELKITGVDLHVGWKRVFDETIEYLRKGTFGDTSKIFEDINVITNYLQADLTDSSGWNDELRTALRKADLVFLVKVLSHIPDDKKLVTLQSIVHCMADDALLIFIDWPYPALDFFNLRNYLSSVYELHKLQFSFKHTRTKFGFPNINKSSATVRIFKKQNSVSGIDL